MARTHVQQSQISGSLLLNDTLAAGSSLAGQGTLVGDLDALRSQIKRAIGEANWYSDVNQDLADIYAAVHMDGTKANFQGAMDVAGVADFDAAIYAASDVEVSGAFTLAGAADLNGSLNVAGVADFQSAMYAASDLEVSGAFVLAGAADLNGSLNVAGVADFQSAMYTASDLEVSGAFVLAGAADLNGSLNVAGVADFQSGVYAASALEVSGTMTVALAATLNSGLTVNNAVADFNAGITANEVKIDGDVIGHMYLVGASGEIQDASELYFDGSTLFVSGAAEISNGLNVLAGGLTVAGDSMEITGSFAVSGSSALDGSLTVSGLATLNGGLAVNGAAADFNADVTANKISIDSDVAQRLYIVDADGSIKDEANLTFDGSELLVTGSAKLTSNLTVEGGSITMSNGSTIDSTVAGELKLTEDLVWVSGDLKVGGNDIQASDGTIAINLSGADVAVKGKLTVEGNEIKSTTGTVMELSGLNAIFKADVQVDGDLRVKGATTYIDTQNMRVEDAFIYLATGSVGTTDSGIALHGGAGAGMDLVIGQDGGAGEVIFGKGNRAPDGDGAMDGIDLVPAWMKEVKFGLAEGVLSGSVGVDGSNLKVSAAADLMLAGNGADAISFISGAGEKTSFDSNFTATTVIGAINELYSLGAGGSKKGNLGEGNVSSGTLTFSSVGTLVTASQQFIDVYLNGVLLAYGSDVSNVTTTTIDLDAGIVLNSDDVLTVVLRGAS